MDRLALSVVTLALGLAGAGCGNTSSGGMCMGAGGVDNGSAVSFGIAVCADCMRSNCCRAVGVRG